MTVYVDPSVWPFRGQLYCHVWADTVDELHAAAQAAGLKRPWFQGRPVGKWEHYDAGPAARAKLVELGAIETDNLGPAFWQATRRNDVDMLDIIERVRRLRRLRADPGTRDILGI